MESGGRIKADLVQKALILALSLISGGAVGLSGAPVKGSCEPLIKK